MKSMPVALRRCLAVAFWLLLWEIAALVCANSLILAGPADVLLALIRLIPQAAFWSSILFSLLRIALGFSIALILGLALGVLASRFQLLKDLLEPFMLCIKSVPVVCVAVLLLLWMGSAWISCAVVAMMALAVWYFACLEALGHIEPRLDDMLRGFGLGRLRRALALHWPSILPYLRSCAKSVMGMSWKAGVAAELIGIPTGSIGERIYAAKIGLESGELFAWTLVIVLMALLCERLFLASLDASPRLAKRLLLSMRPLSQPRRATAPLAVASSTTAPLAVASSTTAPIAVAPSSAAPIAVADATLLPGQGLCLRAPSGHGKTTLLNALCAAPNTPLGSISRVYQDTRLLEDWSALENLLLVTDPASARSILLELLSEEDADKPCSKLSGGMCRKLELCRALIADSDSLVLDEPFSGMDATSIADAIACIQRHRNGRTLVLATHGNEAAALGIPEVQLPAIGSLD